MEIRRIGKHDKRALSEIVALLEQEGISLDDNLDYTLGLYSEDDRLAATGSFYRNTLRCLAVDNAHQGEGLMAVVVSRLVEELFSRGQQHLFVYTKRTAAQSIAALGFYEIAATNEVVFLENRRTAFRDYLKGLSRPETAPKKVGAIVMNANPFSKGHQYLAETAAAACDALHLFMVSEDVSAFPYHVREKLIIEGTRHIPNVYHHPTGPYLVSSATFPSYFIKESDQLTLAQARLDARVFGRIAKELHITDRFVGEEPFSPATHLYNQAMGELLPQAGIALFVVPRMADAGGIPVSATRVRRALAEGDTQPLRALLPDSSYDFVISKEGQALIDKRLAE
jgi:[citrate (pro-3S)-lyase] ligase